jgi:hypothetical protein
MANTKQWFIDRIGKVVYPKNPLCGCNTCKIDYKKGYLIESKMIADDLCSGATASGNTFFDTIKDRDK